LVIDVNNDDKKEILFGDYDGKIRCMEIVGVTKSGNAPYYANRGSIFATGRSDSDFDLVDDFTEKFYGCDINNNDSDLDGLLDGRELLYCTNPMLNDTDFDQMDDFWEVRYHTNARYNDADNDPDRDGLTNLEEYTSKYDIDPLNPDTDGDGHNDGDEIGAGTDPTDPNDVPVKYILTINSFILSLLAFPIIIRFKKKN
jgi:hypothetical protein